VGSCEGESHVLFRLLKVIAARAGTRSLCCTDEVNRCELDEGMPIGAGPVVFTRN
jgi:hypothetical protein